MKALKAAVVIMGILIVAGITVLIVELINRSNRAAEEPASSRVAETDLGLPEGAAITEMVPTGNRLALRVTVPQAGDRVYLIDPRTGAVTATVTTGRFPRRVGEAQ